MSHSDPQEELPGGDYLVAAGDRYKISIINFMYDDKAYSGKILEHKKHTIYVYKGVRDADIRYAENFRRETFLGTNPRGDKRLVKMLRELEKHRLIEQTKVEFKKKRPSNYYTLTPDGEKFYEEIQDLIKKKIVSGVLYCLKDQDKRLARSLSGRYPLVKKSELVPSKDGGDYGCCCSACEERDKTK